MAEGSSRSALKSTTTFLGDVWRGVHAPDDVITKTRKRVDEVMVATGTLGLAESFVAGSPIIFAASAADLGIGLSDLARAGSELRHRHDMQGPQ